MAGILRGRGRSCQPGAPEVLQQRGHGSDCGGAGGAVGGAGDDAGVVGARLGEGAVELVAAGEAEEVEGVLGADAAAGQDFDSTGGALDELGDGGGAFEGGGLAA